jgi:hypothetical protein
MNFNLFNPKKTIIDFSLYKKTNKKRIIIFELLIKINQLVAIEYLMIRIRIIIIETNRKETFKMTLKKYQEYQEV